MSDLALEKTNDADNGTELRGHSARDGYVNDYVLQVMDFDGILTAIVGRSETGTGLAGISDEEVGVWGKSSGGSGVEGMEDSDQFTFGSGVRGTSSLGTGVIGTGPTGVHGEGAVLDQEGNRTSGGVGIDGAGGIGVRGSGEDAGGEFSGPVQLRLSPHRLSSDPGMRSVETYEHLLTDAQEQLPANAQAGSLFTAVTDRGDCSLWFCVSTGRSRSHPARWREVLLGTEWPSVHEEGHRPVR